MMGVLTLPIEKTSRCIALRSPVCDPAASCATSDETRELTAPDILVS